MNDTSNETEIPIVLCCGQNGRAVVFGYVTKFPEPGEPVTMRRARMAIRWEGTRGIFGLASEGPQEGSNISPAVDVVRETVWQEAFVATPTAARAWDEWS